MHWKGPQSPLSGAAQLDWAAGGALPQPAAVQAEARLGGAHLPRHAPQPALRALRQQGRARRHARPRHPGPQTIFKVIIVTHSLCVQATASSLELQCVPLYTLLLAVSRPPPTVHWLILDIEGAELQVRVSSLYPRPDPCGLSTFPPNSAVTRCCGPSPGTSWTSRW